MLIINKVGRVFSLMLLGACSLAPNINEAIACTQMDIWIVRPDVAYDTALKPNDLYRFGCHFVSENRLAIAEVITLLKEGSRFSNTASVDRFGSETRMIIQLQYESSKDVISFVTSPSSLGELAVFKGTKRLYSYIVFSRVLGIMRSYSTDRVDSANNSC